MLSFASGHKAVVGAARGPSSQPESPIAIAAIAMLSLTPMSELVDIAKSQAGLAGRVDERTVLDLAATPHVGHIGHDAMTFAKEPFGVDADFNVAH